MAEGGDGHLTQASVRGGRLQVTRASIRLAGGPLFGAPAANASAQRSQPPCVTDIARAMEEVDKVSDRPGDGAYPADMASYGYLVIARSKWRCGPRAKAGREPPHTPPAGERLPSPAMLSL